MQAEVTAAAVKDLSGDRATVLVATTGTVTNRTARKPVDRTQRLLVSLVNEDSAWLVDDLTYVS